MTSSSGKPPSASVFVQTIDLKLATKLKADLIEQGFELTVPQYTVFAAKKKGLSCTLYLSGKLTVQGKEMSEFLEFYLEPHILGTFTHTYEDLQLDKKAHIGIDESGKGDYFGPLCIAGVFADDSNMGRLKSIGVKDSKLMTDATILKTAVAIRKEFAHHIVRINPLKYNELYAQFNNLNHLLAWGHATTIENLVLKTSCRNVLIDQFASEQTVIRALKRKKLEVELTQRHRGESDPVVAAASILAREAFLRGLKELGEQYGIILPKGASQLIIKVGKGFVSKYGQSALGNIGKLHFKTTQQIITTYE